MNSPRIPKSKICSNNSNSLSVSETPKSKKEEIKSNLEEEKVFTNSGYKKSEASSEWLDQFYAKMEQFAKLFGFQIKNNIKQFFKDIIEKDKEKMKEAYKELETKKRKSQNSGSRKRVVTMNKEENKEEKETDSKPPPETRSDLQYTSKINSVKRIMNDLSLLEGFEPRIKSKTKNTLEGKAQVFLYRFIPLFYPFGDPEKSISQEHKKARDDFKVKSPFLLFAWLLTMGHKSTSGKMVEELEAKLEKNRLPKLSELKKLIDLIQKHEMRKNFKKFCQTNKVTAFLEMELFDTQTGLMPTMFKSGYSIP
ncbi:unnamed protein product [Moneuplotes crassus]|uniref:Uncharacterized protein n=1 Tax=Euplotes crassus TaxID=5936 RepID=A0AAD1UI00_EUPCR|nr:unnamed protein product [Moneuplotes crassus]